MALYYRISPTIWRESWSEDTRTVAFYILTCDHRTTEGLFRLPEAYIVADLGWTPARIRKCLVELEKANFIKRSGDVVLIVKALKTQAPQNPNQARAAVRAVELVPSTELDAEFLQLAEQFSERLTQQLREQLPERFGESLALALAPALTPPPSRGGGGNGAHAEEQTPDLGKYLIAEGWHSDDVDVALKKLRDRNRFGEPIKDPVAWVTPMLQAMAVTRSADPGESQVAVLDGVQHELIDGQWREVASL